MQLVSYREIFSANIINWAAPNISNETRQFILDNAYDYRNLNNDSWWREKMTDEEIEMRKHPNRSHGWIPNRLGEERDALRFILLEAIVGKGNYVRDRVWSNVNCKKCGSIYDDENKFIQDMINCLASTNVEKDAYLSKLPSLEYERLRQECWDTVSKSYDIRTSRAKKITSWRQGSIPVGANRRYGFCNYCWEGPISLSMKEILDRVLIT